MKLNPFSKKSGYLARIKAEHAEAQQKLNVLKSQAAEAQVEYVAKHKASREMEARGNTHLWTNAEVHLSRAADAARQRANALQQQATELERECNRLRAIAEAPINLEQTRAAIIDLRHRRGVLQAEREQNAKLAAKLQARIDDLERRIAAETQLASEAMAVAEGEFTMPESLTRLDTELRVTRATLQNVSDRMHALAEDIATLPKQINEAERLFKHYQSSVADIELHEQLPNCLDVLARASVAAYDVDSYYRREDEYTITIPQQYIEAARAKLAADRPGA